MEGGRGGRREGGREGEEGGREGGREEGRNMEHIAVHVLLCRYLHYGEPVWKEIVKKVLKGVRT